MNDYIIRKRVAESCVNSGMGFVKKNGKHFFISDNFFLCLPSSKVIDDLCKFEEPSKCEIDLENLLQGLNKEPGFNCPANTFDEKIQSACFLPNKNERKISFLMYGENTSWIVSFYCESSNKMQPIKIAPIYREVLSKFGLGKQIKFGFKSGYEKNNYTLFSECCGVLFCQIKCNKAEVDYNNIAFKKVVSGPDVIKFVVNCSCVDSFLRSESLKHIRGKKKKEMRDAINYLNSLGSSHVVVSIRKKDFHANVTAHSITNGSSLMSANINILKDVRTVNHFGKTFDGYLELLE